MKTMSNLTTITNIGKDNYMLDRGNGIYADAVTLAKAAIAPNADKITLYAFDIKTGRAAERVVAMPVFRARETFAPAFAACWYSAEYDKAFAAFDKLPEDTEGMTEDDMHALNVARARYFAVRDVYNAHNANKALACDTVRDFVAAVAKLKDDAFSTAVKDAYKAVKDAYKAVHVDGNLTVGLKPFRAALDVLTHALWRTSNNCAEYQFNANSTLATDVYRAMYDRRKIDNKTGYVISGKTAPDRVVLSEVVYACLECLQNKPGNKAPDTPTDNADKPNKPDNKTRIQTDSKTRKTDSKTDKTDNAIKPVKTTVDKLNA